MVCEFTLWFEFMLDEQMGDFVRLIWLDIKNYPFDSKINQHVISFDNITAESFIKIIAIKKMITSLKSFDV